LINIRLATEHQPASLPLMTPPTVLLPVTARFLMRVPPFQAACSNKKDRDLPAN
jgi:hypothetical protein